MPWAKGQSGNPGGRPKGYAEVRDAARAKGQRCIKRLWAIAEAEDTPPVVKVMALRELLDRGYGKPTASVELTGKDGGPIEHAAMSPEKRLDLIQRLQAEADAAGEGGSTPVAH